MAENADTKEITPTGGIRFSVASRPQRRYSNVQTVSNLNGATSLQPIPLPATGWVRKIGIDVTAAYETSASADTVAGDAPFNLISSVSLTDATGQPVIQPITGYNLYLINKYFGNGTVKYNYPSPKFNPHMGPEYAYAASGTSGSARFRLDLDLEVDAFTGYGSIPNTDSNASLQMLVNVAPASVAFTGGTASAATVSVRIDQWYWAPVGGTIGGQPAQQMPPGAGDYLETRYETQTVSAQTENTIPVNNRGGLVRGIIAISRNAGVRTAYTPGTNIGVVYDNNAIDEGIRLETVQDQLRREYGYYGADIGQDYAPITDGLTSGLDDGVIVFNFANMSAGRDSWLNTRVGTLLQLKATPGSGATQMELVTQLMQVKDASAFYGG